MIRSPGLFAVLMIFTAWASQASAQDSWSPKTEAFDFNLGGSATDGTYLYLFGGNQQGTASTFPDYHRQLRRYDPVSDAWATLEPMPVYSQYNAGAYCNGRLYSFGGYNQNGILDTIQAYTIATNAWEALDVTLSVPRYHLVAATIGNRIYVIGGYFMGASNVNEDFNTLNNSVTFRANMPSWLYWQAIATLNGRVHVIGGYGQGGPSAANYEYTPPDNSSPQGSWAIRSPIENSLGQIQPRMGAAAFVRNGLIHVTGGWNGDTFTDTWIYDRPTDGWVLGAAMNQPRNFHAAAAIGGLGYVYGGGVAPAITTGEKYGPNGPPTADAGPDQTVAWSGNQDTAVTLDGTGSTDPDDDALTYQWVGSQVSASVPTPTINLPLGTHTITLTVTDPLGEEATDTVVISIVDLSPPPGGDDGSDDGGGGGGGGCGSVGLDLMLPLMVIALWRKKVAARA